MRAPLRSDLAQKLWDRLERDPRTGCWLWTGGKHHLGYGMIVLEGEVWMVHKLVWELMRGALPRKHRLVGAGVECRGRLCANPDHRKPLNMNDFADFMGQFVVRGSEHYASRLDEAKVAELRRRRGAGETLEALAAAFGVSPRVVGDIVSGKTWKHVA